jgi:conjugal transfer ATP-binding protein TraC
VQSTEVETALRKAYSSDVRVFSAGVRAVVYDTSDQGVQRAASEVARTFQNVPGVAAVNETVALWPAYLSCSPASGIALHRRSRVFTDNAADFLPLVGPWGGSDRPVMLFGHRTGALVPFDPVDPRLPAWNQMIIGSTGSGKTHLANLLVLNLMATQPLVTIVDRGGGYRTLVQVVGGHTISLGPGAEVAMNPMDVAPGQVERDNTGRIHVDEVKIAFLTAMMGMMVTRGGQAYTDREQLIVSEAARQTYQRLYEEVERGRQILLRDLRDSLLVYQPRLDTPELGAEIRRIANDLALRMTDWVDDGVHARLFDRPTSVNLYGDAVLYFDTEGLPHDSPVLQVAMAIIADVAWRRARREDSPGSLVVLDEAWVYLRVAVATSFIEEMFRRFRRYRAMALVITQEPDDLLSSPIGGVLLNNSQVWYLLRGTYRPEVLDLMRVNAKCQAVLPHLEQVKGQYAEMLLLADLGGNRVGDVITVRPGSHDYWIATSDRRERLIREAAFRDGGGNGNTMEVIRHLARQHPRGLGIGITAPSTRVEQGVTARQ